MSLRNVVRLHNDTGVIPVLPLEHLSKSIADANRILKIGVERRSDCASNDATVA